MLRKNELTMAPEAIKSFSLIIPAFNESENLPHLMREIDEVSRKHGFHCEIIFVDDGSSDNTLTVMTALKKEYRDYSIRILALDRNYGLTTALDAGFHAASGDVVVSIDSDLQNDPADIPRLLEQIPRYDIVIGYRAKRRDPWLKRLSSKVANSVRNCVLKEALRDTGCTLKAFRVEYLRHLKLFDGMHRFLPDLLNIEGARILEVEVSHRPRLHGKSKYHLTNRLTGPLADLLAVWWMRRRKLRYRVTELKS